MRRATGARRGLAGHALLVAACLAAVFPLTWALLASLTPTNAMFASSALPVPSTLEHYRAAVIAFPLGALLAHTAVTAAGVTIGQVAVALLAAYALLRLPQRRRRRILTGFTLAVLVPTQVLIVPLFLAVSRLGGLNTYAGLIVPQLGGAALAVVLLRQRMAALPATVLDAARLDGARPLEILRHVVAPMLAPAIGAVAILVFVTAWNEFLWPTLVAPSPQRRLIGPGLASFTNTEGANPGPLLAAAVLSTLPVLVVYLLAARRVTAAFLLAGPR